jgi:sulfite reductase (NADPH) flavoprotein alpha-component
VAQLAEALGQSEQTEVDALGSCCSLAEALTRRLEIQKVSPSALRRYAGLGAKALDRILDDPEATTKYLDGRDWLDVLREHPAKIEVNQFVSLLPELASRSYSIASSQLEHADEVHLLVSRVHFTAHGRGRQGVASSYLSDRLRLGESARVWIEPNTQFRLPEDSNQPIVLIGAGTGVAPYRAFLEERAAAGQSGKNWVIFGNRQFQADFTYQTDWLRWRKDGVLTRMDVAFSRDQAQKIYVTDRMREQGRELYAWLEQGARLYLCGDRTRLAADVDRTLVEVVMTHGNQSHDEAVTYVEKLRSEKRYSKDVY